LDKDETRALKPLNWYRGLDSLKSRMESGAFLIEGERAIKQIADYHPREIMEILAVPDMAARFPGYPLRILTPKQVSSLASSRTPQGIMAVVRLPLDAYTANLPQSPGDRILLLEHVQDPGNVGTIIRTAAAFGFSGIIMSDKTADPFSSKVVQSTAGSVLSVWIRRSDNYLDLVADISREGYLIAAADLNGTADAAGLGSGSRILLALGNEASGLSQALLDMAGLRVKIPIDRAKAESLNVAVSAGIMMFLAYRRA
jgi:RNA methyltransferase, TrmH family